MQQQEQQEEEGLGRPVGDFFAGRCVLLTGASGFVGRVLLEHLLRTCPDIACVYVLLRARKGLQPSERLRKFTDVPLFDRVRAERGAGALAKVRAVAGDAAAAGLGLAPADAEELRQRVAFVFHLAASVRFDDPLAAAAASNLRSTSEVVQLAAQMPNLQALLHVSTTFCNVGQRVYEERLYPAPADWRCVLRAADVADDHQLRALTTKILGQHCNTYTFSKNLAEHVLEDYAGKLPIGILRPSVVINTYKDPIPGWIDNFNGPIGLLIGAGKGLVHTGFSDPDIYIDFIPCDIIVKGIIISCCEVAKRGAGELVVYQGAQSDRERITQKQLIDISHEMVAQRPFKQTLYHPSGGVTSSRWLFQLQFMLFQLLPALLVDAALYITKRNTFLVRLQRRIFCANVALAWFLMRNWNFVNARFLALEQRLVAADREAFAFDVQSVEARAVFMSGLLGTRQYLLHEPQDDLQAAQARYHRYRILHLVLKILFYVALVWMGLSRLYLALFGTW